MFGCSHVVSKVILENHHKSLFGGGLRESLQCIFAITLPGPSPGVLDTSLVSQFKLWFNWFRTELA